jgi:hypothetical protein
MPVSGKISCCTQGTHVGCTTERQYRKSLAAVLGDLDEGMSGGRRADHPRLVRWLAALAATAPPK